MISSRSRGIPYLISTRNADGARRLRAGATSDVDLRTLHVELRAAGASGAMQGQQLAAEQILAVCDAARDSDGLRAPVRDELSDSPSLAGGIVAVVRDLEPSAADATVGLGVGDLLHVDHQGALVRGVDDIGGGRGQGVAPEDFDGGAGAHGNDG